MIQAESPLGHHLFQVPIAELIAQLPMKAKDDDLVLKVSSAKHCGRLRFTRSHYRVLLNAFATDPKKEHVREALDP